MWWELYGSLKKGNVQVYKDNKIIIEIPRDTETNLWLMPLKNNNNNNNTKQNKQTFVIYN